MGVVNTDPVAKVSAAQSLVLTRALFTRGANIGAMKTDVAVAAADSDTSTYRLFENLDPRLRPLFLLIGCTAITAGTDFDIGIFDTAGGAAITAADALAATLDLSSAILLAPAVAKNGLGAISAANIGKTMYELAGHTTENMRDGYDIVATGSTVGSAAGTISAILIYALPTE